MQIQKLFEMKMQIYIVCCWGQVDRKQQTEIITITKVRQSKKICQYDNNFKDFWRIFALKK